VDDVQLVNSDLEGFVETVQMLPPALKIQVPTQFYFVLEDLPLVLGIRLGSKYPERTYLLFYLE
jgi:hypothetical protein